MSFKEINYLSDVGKELCIYESKGRTVLPYTVNTCLS